jgi:hypothetical protein
MEAMMGLGSDTTDGNAVDIFTDADELQPAKSAIKINPPILFIPNCLILVRCLWCHYFIGEYLNQ